MKLDVRLQQLKDWHNALNLSMKELERDVKAGTRFTDKFLKECSKHKIKKVAIGVADDSIPASKTYPFGKEGSVFSDESRSDSGFPAIWKVVSDLNISGGCGNSFQHEVTKEGTALLIDGVYHFEQGKWRRLEKKG